MNNQQIGRDEKKKITFSKADRYSQLGEAENGNSEALQNCRFGRGEGPPRQRCLRACVHVSWANISRWRIIGDTDVKGVDRFII